jgi:prolyl 4-hydroxylase
VEQWAGVALKQTLLYGIRVYTEGAALDEHVDTLSTHVISLILNIGQEGVAGPWPLTIKDHSGRRHLLEMEPGEMVSCEALGAALRAARNLSSTSTSNRLQKS